MAQSDPLADAKKLLADTEGLASAARKPHGGKDVELPNRSGQIDARLAASRTVERPREQPRSMKENVSLRRSLTSRR